MLSERKGQGKVRRTESKGGEGGRRGEGGGKGREREKEHYLEKS
jgi:hypothetical protein